MAIDPFMPDWTYTEGTEAADVLATGTIFNRIDAYGGDDTISVGHRYAVVHAGAGDDTITADLDLDTTDDPPGSDGDGGPSLLGEDGDDSITAVQRVAGTGVARSSVGVLGGAGDDRLVGDVLAEGMVTYSQCTATGDEGNDLIDATSVARTPGMLGTGRTAQASVSTLGFSGDDTISSTAIAWNAATATAFNQVGGYSGNDIVSATTRATATGSLADCAVFVPLAAGNDAAALETTAEGVGFGRVYLSVNAAGGDDTVHSVADVAMTGGAAEMVADAWGGAGDDRLHFDTAAAGEGGASVEIRLDAGLGNDAVTLESAAGTGATGIATVAHEIHGMDGDDVISAIAVATGGAGSRAGNILVGWAGTDTIRGSAEGVKGATGYNWIDGGEGADTLVGTIVGSGRSTLIGGNGADSLRVIGGMGSRMDGGKGDDRLHAGGGDDVLTGAAGVDCFVFDLSEAIGDDRVTDFAAGEALGFLGTDDPGALARFDDAGPGGDLVVTFAGLGTITFTGMGTGAIDAFDDFATLI